MILRVWSAAVYDRAIKHSLSAHVTLTFDILEPDITPGYVKKTFFYVFYSGHVYYVFNVFYFANVLYF